MEARETGLIFPFVPEHQNALKNNDSNILNVKNFFKILRRPFRNVYLHSEEIFTYGSGIPSVLLFHLLNANKI